MKNRHSMKGLTVPKFSNRRPLTAAERAKLVAARRGFSDLPPWTKEKVSANKKFRKVLADLFYTGVPQEALAEATDMAVGSIHQQIRKARQEGLLPKNPKDRDLPPRNPKQRPRTSNQRPLTEKEEERLRTLHEAFAGPQPVRRKPRGPGRPVNPSDWASPAAARFIAYVEKLNADGVPIARCAETVGITRAMLTSRLPRKAPSPNTEGYEAGKHLTPKMARELEDLADSVPRGWERREVDGEVFEAEYRVWRHPDGIAALRRASDLIDSGYDVVEIESAMGFPVEPETYRAQISRLLRVHAARI